MATKLHSAESRGAFSPRHDARAGVRSIIVLPSEEGMQPALREGRWTIATAIGTAILIAVGIATLLAMRDDSDRGRGQEALEETPTSTVPAETTAPPPLSRRLSGPQAGRMPARAPEPIRPSKQRRRPVCRLPQTQPRRQHPRPRHRTRRRSRSRSTFRTDTRLGFACRVTNDYESCEGRRPLVVDPSSAQSNQRLPTGATELTFGYAACRVALVATA